MASDTSLVFNLIARDRVSSQLNTVNGRFGRLHDTLKGLIGPALAFGAIDMLGGFIKDAQESAKVSAITEQRLKSTGGAANITATQVGNLATAISNKTGADDEAIQSGENLLLTFTNVRNEAGKGNDIFNQATQAATDMAAAMNGGTVDAAGLKTANIQLGKALNDPIKGISALQKVGVSFTGAQKKQIETMVKSGDTMGAQKVILGELKKEFGGTAAASATPMQKLKTTLDNLGETLGGVLLPYVNKFATLLGNVATYIQKNSSWLIPLVAALGGLVAVIFGIVKAYQAWVAIQEVLNVVMDANPIGLIILAIGLLVAAIVFIATKTTWFQTIWGAVWGFVKNLFSTVVGWIGSKISWLVSKYQWLRDKVKAFFTTIGSWVISKVKAAFDWVSSKITWIHGKFSSFYSKVKGLFQNIKDWIVTKFRDGFNWVSGKVDWIVGVFKKLPGRISRAASGMFNGIKSAFKGAVNWIIGKWNGLSFKIGGGSILGHKLPSVTLSTPNIPYLAKGGTAMGAGAAIVGEKGPELISMPKGARVNPLPRGGSSAEAPTVVISFKKTGDGLMDALLDELRDRIRIEGGNVQTVLGRG